MLFAKLSDIKTNCEWSNCEKTYTEKKKHFANQDIM